MTPGLALIISGSALLGTSCARAAERKNRSAAAWFVWGALFGLVARLVIFALEPAPKQEWQL